MSPKIILTISALAAAVGFLAPLWPVSAVGIALAALSGRWISAAFMGLVLDVAWGAPMGALHYIYLPFTALALALALARYFFGGYFLNRGPLDTL